jgi:hypothetical protein
VDIQGVLQAISDVVQWCADSSIALNERGRTDAESEQPPQSKQKVTGNFLLWEKRVWRVRHEEDEATFPDQEGSVLRHLARLLAEPNRRFRALDFYPLPVGAAPLPHLGRDESSDDQALEEYRDSLKRLAQEIKEADDAHDAETAAKSREKFENLRAHLDAEMNARKRGHKKRCGTPSPEEKADQALRVGLKRLRERFQKEGLPKLAEHLDKYINNRNGEWWYAPPPDTAPWHIARPDTSPDK